MHQDPRSHSARIERTCARTEKLKSRGSPGPILCFFLSIPLSMSLSQSLSLNIPSFFLCVFSTLSSSPSFLFSSSSSISSEILSLSHQWSPYSSLSSSSFSFTFCHFTDSLFLILFLVLSLSFSVCLSMATSPFTQRRRAIIGCFVENVEMPLFGSILPKVCSLCRWKKIEP